ncbi:hypothetical protein AB4Z54_43925 [Streptomyces sp. MCAF7]
MPSHMPHIPVDALGGQIKQVRQVADDTKPVVVHGVPHDQETIEKYAALGVDHVLLSLPTQAEAEALHTLDEMAECARLFAEPQDSETR